MNNIREKIEEHFEGDFISSYIDQLSFTINQAIGIIGYYDDILSRNKLTKEESNEIAKRGFELTKQAYDAYRDLYQLYKDNE